MISLSKRLAPVGIVLAGLAVSGATCQNIGGVTPTEQLLISCEAYSSALTGLAVLSEGLSASQVQSVNDARSVINPVCLDGNYTSPEQALDTIQVSLLQLLAVKQAVGGN